MGVLDSEDIAEQVQPEGVLLGLLVAAGAPICRELLGGGLSFLVGHWVAHWLCIVLNISFIALLVVLALIVFLSFLS